MQSVQVHGGDVRPAPDPAAALAGGADLVWTSLTDPSPDEVAEAVRALGVTPELVRAVRADDPDPDPDRPTVRRRAHLVEVGDARGVVLLTATYDDAQERVPLGLLTVLVDGRSVVTLQRGPGPDLGAALHHRHDKHGAGLLEAVVEAALAGYDAVLDGLDEDVTEVEHEVFSDDRTSHAKRVYGLRREALQLQRAVLPLPELTERLACSRALRARVARVGEHVDRLDALLDSVLSADLAQVGVRQNRDQRTISAWAAIALVPTIIAGIYGMNFQHMPELSWRYGYPAALLLIVGACTALWVAFRRHGWLSGHD